MAREIPANAIFPYLVPSSGLKVYPSKRPGGHVCRPIDLKFFLLSFYTCPMMTKSCWDVSDTYNMVWVQGTRYA
jgi:hypothetical protein